MSPTNLPTDFDADPLGRSPARGFDRERSGDIEVAMKPYWIMTSAGTTHGSNNAYDTRVPLILMGKGVTPGEYRAPASPADIALTLAFSLLRETAEGEGGP